MRLPRTLSSRLAATAVALVVVVSVLLALATTLAVRGYLTDQLDRDVERAADRTERDVDFYRQTGQLPGAGLPDDGPGDGPRIQGLGSLTAFLDVPGRADTGGVLTEGRGDADLRALSSTALEILGDVPADGDVHEVDLPGVGRYRVVVEDSALGTAVAGLPTDDVDDVVSTLVTVEVVLVLLGGALAAVAGTVVVRRQLRPVR